MLSKKLGKEFCPRNTRKDAKKRNQINFIFYFSCILLASFACFAGKKIVWQKSRCFNFLPRHYDGHYDKIEKILE